MAGYWIEKSIETGLKVAGTFVAVIGIAMLGVPFIINGQEPAIQYLVKHWQAPLLMGIFGVALFGAGYAVEASINSRTKV